jgi:hypothetical protein
MKLFSTPLIVLTILAFLFVLERLFPLRRRVRELGARLLVNFSISALTFFVAAFLVRPAAQAALHWANTKPFGLIHLVLLPTPLAFVISFLLMDLAFYYWHIPITASRSYGAFTTFIRSIPILMFPPAFAFISAKWRCRRRSACYKSV